MSHGDLQSLLASGMLASRQFRRSVYTTWGFVLRRSILGGVLSIVQVFQPLWQKNHDFWSRESETLTKVFGERQVSIRGVLRLHIIIVRFRSLGILRLGAVVPGLLSLHSV